MRASDRVDYMDAARSALMSLGVVLHSARVYAPGDPWLVADARTAPVFAWIADGIHLFRMPAFFFIAGFFAALTLERYGARRFLRQRLPRIVLPLATVALLVNAPQVHWLVAQGLLPEPGWRAWLDGQAWVLHLWFLFNLILYFALAAAAGPAAARLIRRGAADGLRGAATLIVAATAVCLLIVPLGVLDLLHERLLFFGPVYGLIRYFCLFLVGFAVFADPRLREAWFRHGWAAVPLAFAAAVAASRLPGAVGDLTEYLAVLWRDLAATWVVLLLFRALASGPSAAWRYMSEASYTIYLLHHPIVIALGVALLAVPLGAGPKFALVCGGAFALSLALHHFLVLKLPIARLLLNGRELPKPVPATPPAAA
jgi:glucans biosynthesis protein C